jgi:hypothetical protein
MIFYPELLVNDNWIRRDTSFAFYMEAFFYAFDMASRWSGVKNIRVVKTEGSEYNSRYTIDGGRLHLLHQGDEVFVPVVYMTNRWIRWTSSYSTYSEALAEAISIMFRWNCVKVVTVETQQGFIYNSVWNYDKKKRVVLSSLKPEDRLYSKYFVSKIYP